MKENVISIIRKIENSASVYLVTYLIFIGIIVYFRVLFNGFVWDDQDQILNNPLIAHLENISYFFTASTFSTGGGQLALSGAFYRPLLDVVFSLTYSIWGLNPFGYHLFDVSLHITNSILIFFLIKNLLDLRKYKFSRTSAFFASVLFLVQPANVESVAYVSATTELMYVFFILVSIITALKFCLKKEISILNLLVIFLTTLGSLFSKESGVFSIVFVIMLSLIFFRKKLIPLLVSCGLSAGVYSFFRFHVATLSADQNLSPIPIAHATLVQRLLTVPYELFSYIRLIFYPVTLHISQVDLITNINDYRFYFLLPVVLLIFISLGIILLRSKVDRKILIFFSLWFLLSLSIVLNIIPLDFTIEERWLYLPLIGVFGIFSLIFIKILNSNNSRNTMLTFLCYLLFFVFFFLRTFIRTIDWENPLTLFGHDIILSANSSELLNNYGVALYNDGQHEKAKEEFLQAIKFAPNNLWTLNNIGSIYAQEGDYNSAKSYYEKSIKLSPTSAAYENIALIYSLTDTPTNTINFINQALPIFPNSAKLNQLMALALFANGKKEEAKEYAQKSLQLDSSQENINALNQVLQ